MSDELDPGLRRLFAETAEHPSDDAFVAAVTARTAREPRMSPALRSLLTGALSALALAAIAAALGLALQQGSQVIMPLLTTSPAGMAASLALVVAGAICFRLVAPLVQRRV